MSSSGEGRGGRHRNGHVLHESDASLSQIGDREGGENNNNNVSNEPTPANNNNGVMKTWEISIEVEKDRKTDESVQDHEIGIATTSRDE